jgi:hypothetical protein
LLVQFDPDEIEEDPNDKTRVLAIIGTNLGKTRRSLTFKIVEHELTLGTGEAITVPKIEWTGDSSLTASDLTVVDGGDRGPGARVEARIQMLLRDGPMWADEMFRALEADLGSTKSTNFRAVDRLRHKGHILKAKQSKFQGRTLYALAKDVQALGLKVTTDVS